MENFLGKKKITHDNFCNVQCILLFVFKMYPNTAKSGHKQYSPAFTACEHLITAAM